MSREIWEAGRDLAGCILGGCSMLFVAAIACKAFTGY